MEKGGFGLGAPRRRGSSLGSRAGEQLHRGGAPPMIPKSPSPPPPSAVHVNAPDYKQKHHCSNPTRQAHVSNHAPRGNPKKLKSKKKKKDQLSGCPNGSLRITNATEPERKCFVIREAKNKNSFLGIGKPVLLTWL